MKRTTEFSNGRVFRYTLWREWPAPTPDMLFTPDPHLAYYPGQHHQFVMFIGLNPSVADETKDDPTIRRCIGFAQSWGFGALCMTNLFAYRSTDPDVMKNNTAHIGPANDTWLLKAAKEATLIIAAWGKHGRHADREARVLKMFFDCKVKLHCLRYNQDGTPEHPLYIPKDTQPVEFDGAWK